jgi:hypothetical protein
MRDARKARGVGLLLVGMLVGMLLISPAAAHFTQNTKHLGQHVWQQVIKQKVFTKQQANKRFKDRCPAGTRKAAGACVEQTTRGSATWADANVACSNLGRRLPTAGELIAAFQTPGITPATETTSNIHIDDNGTIITQRQMVVTSTSTIGGQASLSTVVPYRCVAPLSNANQ